MQEPVDSPYTLNIAFREGDDYHALAVLDQAGGLVTPLPLDAYRRTKQPKSGSYRDTHGIWEVHEHTGRHLGYVKRIHWPATRQLAIDLMQAVHAHFGSSTYEATLESEAARAGVYLAHDPHPEFPQAALLHADGTSPYTLRPLWSAEAPALKAWLPVGLTFQRARVVWHPAPKFETIPD